MTKIKVVSAAKILGRHPSTVAVMCRDGRLKATKRGKTWWLDEAYVQRIASTILPSEVAGRGNLVNGRLPGTVTKDEAAEIAKKHVPENRAWNQTKPVTGAHTTSMQEAIAKREAAQAETLARIAAMGKKVFE